MKVINEKGKLFGIINIVDLLALLLILFVGVIVVWRLFGDSIAAAAEKNREEEQAAKLEEVLADRVKVTYTVRCSNLRESFFDELDKLGYPQQLAIIGGVVDGAFITDAYAEPSTAIFSNIDGDSVESTYGSRVDIVVTIEALVLPNTFISVGSQEVRVGKSHAVKTQFWEVSGIIETMDFDPAPFVEAGLETPYYPPIPDK